jgi:mono/diheme cytochrome c family protein
MYKFLFLFAVISIAVLLSIAVPFSANTTQAAHNATIQNSVAIGDSTDSLATVSYAKDIQSLFDERCTKCHGGGERVQSGLKLTSYENLMSGGKHGVPVVAGKADSSIIIQKLRPDPPFGKQMPFSGKKLSEEEIQKIADWINQGANNN